MEAQVGILEYVQKGKEFSAALKGLYSDFQVHEIYMEGKLIHLTTLNQLILDQIKDRKLSIFMAKKDQAVNAEQPVQRHALFVLYEKIQTAREAMIVLSKIAKESTVHLPSLMVAGPPNEIRVITSQLVTATDYVVALQSESNLKPQPKETLGSFRVTDKPLGHGVPKINSFSMVLSNIFVDKDFIEVNLKSLKAIGFINYYGTQCFGTRAHLVGKQILLNQWKPAIDLISEEFQGQQKFRPKEHQLCSSMEKDVNDLVDASHVIPFSLRRKYIHAYQSFIWNTVVSKRIATFGTTPIVGDLVHAPWAAKHSNDFDESDVSTSSNEEDRIQCQFIFVDTNNIHNYTIDDIVLPLPGYNITYPVNAITDWYRTLLLADGLTEMDFKRKIKKYNLDKTYRRLVSKPSNLNWKFISYKNPPHRDVPPGLDPEGKTEFLNTAVEGSSESNREYPEEQSKISQVSASATSQSKKQNSSTFKSMPSASPKRKSSVARPVGSDVKYEDDAEPMSYEEKKQLSVGIQLLPSDKLARVVHIFQSLEPVEGFKQVDGPYPEDTVMDLEKLKPSTLRILESYLASLPITKPRGVYERKVPEKEKNKRELTNLKPESLSADAEEVIDNRTGAPSNSKADGNHVLVVEFKIPASSDAAMVLREIMKMDVSAMFDGRSGTNDYPAEVSKSLKESRKKGVRVDQIVSEITSFSESPEKIQKKRLKLTASQ